MRWAGSSVSARGSSGALPGAHSHRHRAGGPGEASHTHTHGAAAPRLQACTLHGTAWAPTGVVGADEHVSQDPQRAQRGRDVQPHEPAHALVLAHAAVDLQGQGLVGQAGRVQGEVGDGAAGEAEGRGGRRCARRRDAWRAGVPSALLIPLLACKERASP